MGPVKWSYFYLYVILDIFSRRVVGWRIEPLEKRQPVQGMIYRVLWKRCCANAISLDIAC